MWVCWCGRGCGSVGVGAGVGVDVFFCLFFVVFSFEVF